ncbi:hypothetical protein Pmani_001246 [Petrolisthes manimaculis]|uniref:Uncharacterized protein n=1 Tax=Petrolisthes manimaculis TaxID=1843537 RepID=A0AAE1QL63_9EUCA|nr:hypothetical protein Pmani_001246 [Petrolisthes manimaculis]
MQAVDCNFSHSLTLTLSTCSTSLQNPDVCAALQPVDCNFSHSLTHLNTEYLFYIPPKPGRVISNAASGL